MKKRMCLTIDTGSRGIGWALWDLTQPNWGLLTPPINVGMYTPSSDEWYDACDEAVSAVYSMLTKYGASSVERIYAELPVYQSGSSGLAAANSGSLVKLAVSFGSFVGLAWYLKAQVIPVTPGDWKGTLPKEVVEKRIRQRYQGLRDMNNWKSHAWDAVGIGLWLKGHF